MSEELTVTIKKRKCYVVSYSGGVGSFAAAFRLKYERKIEDEIILVFTDTLIEDEDLYRFLVESARLLELPLVWLADGRNPWAVFKDVGFQGNSRTAPCSKILKRLVMTRYVDDLAKKNPHVEYVLVLGIDIEEEYRIKNAQRNNPRYKVIAPLCDSPYMSASDREQLVSLFGMELPKLYKLGFPHNNCGGFCVRAGLAQFALLRQTMPDRYEFHSVAQSKLVAENPKLDRPFLRKKINGVLTYLGLKTYGEMLDREGLSEEDKYSFGGCGCFVDDEEIA